MKTRYGLLGLALSFAFLNSANAAVSAGGQDVFSGDQQPEGELLLSVFDPVSQVTYTRDLGIDVVTTDFDSASFTISADSLYLTLFGKVDPATLQYSVVGGQNDLDALVVLGVWFTSSSPAGFTTIDTFSALSTAHGNLFDFTVGTNEETATPDAYGNDVSVEVSDPNSTGYYGNPFTTPETFGSLTAYSTAAAPGESMPFFKTEISNATAGQVVTSEFAGTWTLGVDGTLSYSADVDTDGDGVPDSADNCLTAANPNQIDSNGDGYGNVCDADFNDDCVVNVIDLGFLRSVFFTPNPDADLNGDGIVNVVDLGFLRSQFFQAPGPSGTTTICD